ncbi:phosphate ABC transporter ATP-binding protein [Geosporobacter ferrireducens]|uniref:ABC transporter ATP-binding protein n=1 Tax=Geosporobacter ferrireducens TaxID=1424294 RepID=UPI00139EE090|nr:phosphate ABC transporter ATP-binding protein [Geosporobacter ferrireducens]MTI58326.1 phosphate ABC transporter ATP-binding protein [Geosporobacter ferrireducens]
MSPVFEIQGLVKGFNGKTVLDIEHLSIGSKAVTAIIGPSGAGKSTLLSILNGLMKADAGSLIFEGQDMIEGVKLGDPLRTSMAMVFQNPVMFQGTVYDNIAYSLKIRKAPENDIKEKVNEILELIGLKHIALQKAGTISGGEAQRIALARAMVFRPKVLLLDEPTASLDPANVMQIEKLIVHAKKEFGTSVILVTHNMFQARRLADYTVFMLNGNIVESGDNERIFTNPANEKTKAFISGEMVY